MWKVEQATESKHRTLTIEEKPIRTIKTARGIKDSSAESIKILGKHRSEGTKPEKGLYEAKKCPSKYRTQTLNNMAAIVEKEIISGRLPGLAYARRDDYRKENRARVA